MRPMDVKQREIAPQPGVRAHRACAFFGAVSLLLSLSTWSEIGSLGPFRNARTASDTGLVCDWSAVDREHDAACAPGICPGHGADDALPFRGLFGDNATVSNAAFYAATHPLDAALPYAYDALHWAACGAASPLASGNG